MRNKSELGGDVEGWAEAADARAEREWGRCRADKGGDGQGKRYTFWVFSSPLTE